MPLFFIISGYLYKERPIMDIIRRNTKKVLVPYIVTGGDSMVYFINYKRGL